MGKEIHGVIRGEVVEFLHTIENRETQYFYSRLAYIATSENKEENISIDKNVVDLVRGSIIDELPKEEPECMKRPYCISCGGCRIGEMDEVYLARYEESTVPGANGIMYFCLGKNDKYAISANFVIDWEKSVIYTGENMTPEKSTQTEWNDEFVKFLVTFALMYDADNTPFDIRQHVLKPTSIQRKSGKKDRIDIDISIDPKFIEKAMGNVFVKGHIRNQAYGVQWSEHRRIYIAPFEYTRMLVVHGKGEKDE